MVMSLVKMHLHVSVSLTDTCRCIFRLKSITCVIWKFQKVSGRTSEQEKPLDWVLDYFLKYKKLYVIIEIMHFPFFLKKI